MKSRIEELEGEKTVQLEVMATIISKNEELEKEISILTRALQIKD